MLGAALAEVIGSPGGNAWGGAAGAGYRINPAADFSEIYLP
ncbi:MAG: hypothetical protein O2967_08140 [Proteobacteria bacterium]|nr:hypothetical protein [Pseudomonadota bacterium]